MFLLLQVSFRMVLPSEGHRRRQRQDHRPRSPRLSVSSSFSSDVASPSPSASSLLLPDEAAVPKELSNASVLSVGEESFDDFTLRMIKQYVRDQDARSRHQVRRGGCVHCTFVLIGGEGTYHTAAVVPFV